MDVGASDRCFAAKLATRSGSQWTCSTSCVCSSVRFPTGGGTLVRFDFQESGGPGWIAAPAAAQMALRVLQEGAIAPRVRAINLPGQSRALSLLSYRAIRSANRSCTGLASLPTMSVALYALAEF